MMRYDMIRKSFELKNWQASCQFNQVLKSKHKSTENVLNKTEMRESDMEVLLCKTCFLQKATDIFRARL